jgi:uncharacterized membrane protein YgdD (TMEM256/DUF423 family)
MHKLFLLAGTVFGGLGVAIGAFGAHKLKDILLKNARADVFETSVKYQFYHALALLAVGLLLLKTDDKLLSYSGWCFIWGIIIFSGSLYTLSLTNIKMLGAVAPIGGTLFIAGWVMMFLSVWKNF